MLDLIPLPAGPLLFFTWAFGGVCGFIAYGLLASSGRDVQMDELREELREARSALKEKT